MKPVSTNLRKVSLLIILQAILICAQVKIPDRFVKSGVNLALNQQLFEEFAYVFEDLFKNLSTTDMSLRFPHILNLRIQNDTTSNHTVDLVDWTIENLNIRHMTFDVNSTNFVLIEPSQKIKMYFSNLNLNIDFISNFTTNPHLLIYEELRNASIYIKNISFTIVYQLEVDNTTKALRAVLDQILINGLGDNLVFNYTQEGLFIHQIKFIFDILKEYTMTNINSLLLDFKQPIQDILDKVMVTVSKTYLNFNITQTDPPIKGFFGLIKSENQQYSPLIFDNYLSIQSYGMIYENRTLNITNTTFDNYLPLYLNIDSSTQIFISQQTINELSTTIQTSASSTWDPSHFLGLECNTTSLNKYIPNFDSTFGPSKACTFEIISQVPMEISFAAGDIYIEANSYQISAKFLDDELEEYTGVTFNVTIKSIIFGFNVTENLLYYYELKNFFLTSIEKTYSSKSSFTFDSTTFLSNMEKTYKNQIREQVSKNGQAGNPVDLSIFGQTYQNFWKLFFTKSSLNIKHQYAQVTIENSRFQDYTLFRDAMYSMLSLINNTIYSNDTNEFTMNALYYFGGLEQFKTLFSDTQKPSQVDRKLTAAPKKSKKPKTFMDTVYDQYNFIKKDLSVMTNVMSKVFSSEKPEENSIKNEKPLYQNEYDQQ